ncbi:hypothetical protein GMOD_00005897 [Pyrenophora seminiperda CCB06]|uniref:Uncharacterized protein n=1 Tax=Pyrenophora seminiperda CCB06 TaxID=1302712 RepID=A0A3M7MAF3_9PLEO|nr:hypothetical protein GMOD_00005897 [Pyrenophora seminiperda CCB06]
MVHKRKQKKEATAAQADGDEDVEDGGVPVPLDEVEVKVNGKSKKSKSGKKGDVKAAKSAPAVKEVEWETEGKHQSVTTDEPVEIDDVEDDLNRELAFYKQCLSSVKDARKKLKKEGVSFSRPADYFAEMVKSDEHMGKIKQKLIDAAAGKKAAAEARKQRDLKKFGKQVQVAKMQERAKEKRDTIEKISTLKRKRQGADITATNEEDLFDVAATATDSKSDRRGKSDNSKSFNPKRQKKDQKYGFGGKKRFGKSNDAQSSADGRDFSVRKMKGKSAGEASKRPGKERRSKKH